MELHEAFVNGLAALVRDLRAQGAVVDLDPTSRRWSLLSYAGEALPSPAVLDFTEEQFAAHLELISGDAQQATGEAEPRAAAYHLFLVHIDELLRSGRPSPHRVWLENGRMRSDAIGAGSEPPYAHTADSEGWFWSVDPPQQEER